MKNIAVDARMRSGKAAVKRDIELKPFLKWAGGKRQLTSTIRKYIPKEFKVYFEPFVGAGAVLFEIQPSDALINDANAELINCYRVVRDQSSKLIEDAKRHRNTKAYFYKLRALDRTPTFDTLSTVERASRILFLNKTCFNGLFRVNSQGHFNVPYSNYTNPRIVDEIAIKAVSRYFRSANIRMTSKDFEEAVTKAKTGDFIYFDPPYDPLSDTSSFTGYNLPSFDREEQERLKEVCDGLSRRGCQLLLSNSATPFIRKLYSDKRRYTIVEVKANRYINSVANGRGKIKELLILNNYDF